MDIILLLKPLDILEQLVIGQLNQSVVVADITCCIQGFAKLVCHKGGLRLFRCLCIYLAAVSMVLLEFLPCKYSDHRIDSIGLIGLYLKIEFHLQYLSVRVGAVSGENLLKIGGYAVVCHGAVPHDKVVGTLLGNGLDGFLGEIAVETGNQVVVLHLENLLASNDRLLNLGRERNAQIQHDLEQQILGGAVFLDVVCQHIKHISAVGIGSVVNILHVAGIQFQHTEANVKVLGGEGILLFDFLTRTANAFLADFADVLVASLVCLGFVVGGFWKLNHDEFAVSTVVSV